MRFKASLRTNCVYLVFIATIAVCSNSFATCEKALVHGWGGEWEPFVLGTPEEPSGLDMDILDAVINASDCTWKNTKHAIPWARHLGLIKSGGLDLATAASWTEERAQYAYFTAPYRSEYVALFIHKNDLPTYSKLSIEELFLRLPKIGRERSNSYGPIIDRLIAKHSGKMEEVNDNSQAIPMLTSKRITGYLGFLPHETLHIKDQGLENEIVILPLSVTKSGEVHIMLSRKANSVETLKALEAGLAKIKSNGTYNKIIEKYSLEYGNEYW